MTPDGNPLVGELPGVPGFFVAAGLSLNGFGGRRRHRQGRGRARHGGRERARPAGLPALALRGSPPRSALRRRDRARGLSLLLPPALSARQRHARPSAAHERAARAHAGRGRGVRDQERLGARRLLRSRAPVAQGGGGAACLRLGRAALRGRAGRGVGRPARARGHDRHDVLRQDRRRGPRRRRAARARVRRARRPRAGRGRLHAVPERARGHRRRRDRHAPGRASASASSRAPRRSTPTSAGCGCTPPTAKGPSSCATRPRSCA